MIRRSWGSIASGRMLLAGVCSSYIYLVCNDVAYLIREEARAFGTPTNEVGDDRSIGQKN